MLTELCQRRTPSVSAALSAIALPLLFVAGPVIASDAALAASLETQTTSDRNSKQSQVRISQLADETQDLLGDYRVTVQTLDRLTIYNDHLAKLVADQEEEKSSIQNQLENFAVVEQEIVPLMMDMITSLGQFIELDVPFLLDERRGRVSRLQEIMDQADVTVSEKYRQIMDAYQIETTFGRDIEAYKGPLQIDGVERQVDFFRVGRILLAYQTPDREQTGFWNKESARWESLPDEYRNFVTQGLRIARKQAAPDLLRLPVAAPENVQ
jgi:hypothetical protein